MPTAAKTIRDVKNQERLAIRERRAVHGDFVGGPETPKGAVHDEDRVVEKQEPEDLTGLALSGGGIRAAAFSLGFIQSMCRAGRMKAFDYLSTVSGGGYAGCLFSSTVARRKDRINWDRGGKYNRLDFEQNPDGSQPDAVKRLSLHGRMMGNFLRLLSRHLWGFLVNLTFTISGIVAIASVLAYMMRIPWSRNMLPILSELGFTDDISVAFFFAYLMFIVWVASHVFMYGARLLNRKVAPITQLTYLLLIASLVLGGINILALGDIDIGRMFTGRGSNDRLQTNINEFVGWISLAISGAFATSMIPYLSPKRLLQSGGPKANRVQSAIFRAAGNGLVIGLPLVIYFFLVHENISGWNSDRPNSDLLTASHLKPVELAVKLESQAASGNEMQMKLARDVYEALTADEFTAQQFVDSDVKFDELLKNVQSAGEQKRLTDEKYGLISRCFHWMADAIHLNERFSDRVQAIKDTRAYSERIADRFNERIISRPGLFVSLLEAQAEEDKQGQIRKTGSNHNLLVSLGLPAGTPVPSNDNSLELALESLRNTEKQWKVRFGTNITELKLSAGDDTMNPDRQHFIAALLVLANEATSNDPIIIARETDNAAWNTIASAYRSVAAAALKPIGRAFPKSAATLDRLVLNLPNATSAKVTDQSPHLRFREPTLNGPLVTRLQTLLEDKNLRSKVESKLAKLGLPSNFEDSAQKQLFDEWQTKLRVTVQEMSRQTRTKNWQVLSAMYPNLIRPQETVFAYTVNAQDQSHRLWIAMWATLIFIGLGVTTNLNNTSLHGVYRDQLGEFWLADPQIQLHELENACKNGAPFHLVNGTVNRMGHRLDPDTEGKSRFTFSHRFCGTNKIGFRETKQYNAGDMRLADAMAISGGAVTSVNAPTMLHQLILFLTNFRLGQWLPNTQTYKEDFYWASPLRALVGLLSRPEQRSHCFVSDGGHIDNTGLSPLLERRCRLMVFVDSSFDPDYEFSNLLSVMHDGRAKYGVNFEPFDTDGNLPVDKILDRLRPSNKSHGQSDAHFVAFKVQYPERDRNNQPVPEGILIVCKLTVTGEEPIEIVEKARGKGDFPHHPTTDQFLPPEVFESYVMLGRHVGDEVDAYAEAGSLSEFEVPESWRSPSDSSTSEQSTSLPQSKTTSNDAAVADTFREVEQQLQGLAFDEDGINQASEILNQWRDEQLVPVTHNGTANESDKSPSIDTSVFEMVSNWARDDDRGIDATLKLRTKFCAPLLQHIEDHRDTIVGNVEAKKQYRVLLSVVGHGVRNARKSIEKLSQSKDKANSNVTT